MSETSTIRTVSFDKDFSDFRGAIRKDTVDLKRDLIRLIGQGFNLAEIVQSLSGKYHVSQRDIYYHYSTLDKWTQYFLTTQQAKQDFLSSCIRLDYIYRSFSFLYLNSSDTNVKLGALNGMLRTIRDKAELKKDQEIDVLIKEVEEIKKTLGEKR